jgi:hypothetical protein
MKKLYMIPSMKMVESESEELMQASAGVTSEKGIEYGGVDEGQNDPDSRRSFTGWYDED